MPFTGDILDPTVLDAAIRIAHAEHAVLVPAYLLLVPLKYALESPLASEVAIAMPLLEAVEHAALRAGIPVDARIEKGRTPTHALERLWEVESFDRVIAPAPTQADQQLRQRIQPEGPDLDPHPRARRDSRTPARAGCDPRRWRRGRPWLGSEAHSAVGTATCVRPAPRLQGLVNDHPARMRVTVPP